MADTAKPLLIKRYASRRLYNTETSDYVTLDNIASSIREGREVQIVDLKSGDDLTRQYLLQIIAEHESRGESVLPVDVLTEVVRSYTSQAAHVVPQFLTTSFEMLRQGQNAMMENLNKSTPASGMPGFDTMRAQQEAFIKALGDFMPQAAAMPPDRSNEIDTIKAELAELQEKLSKLDD